MTAAFAVRRPSRRGPAAGVGSCAHGSAAMAQMVHIHLLFPRRGGSVRRVQFFRQLRQRTGQQHPLRLLHHAALQRFRRVARRTPPPPAAAGCALPSGTSFTRCTVAPVTFTPYASAASCTLQAVVARRRRRRGSATGVHVENPVGIAAAQHLVAQDGQIARQHHHVHAVRPASTASRRRVERARRGIAFPAHTTAGDARFGRALQRVRPCACEASTRAIVRMGQLRPRRLASMSGLQIRAAAGNQHRRRSRIAPRPSPRRRQLRPGSTHSSPLPLSTRTGLVRPVAAGTTTAHAHAHVEGVEHVPLGNIRPAFCGQLAKMGGHATALFSMRRHHSPSASARGMFS